MRDTFYADGRPSIDSLGGQRMRTRDAIYSCRCMRASYTQRESALSHIFFKHSAEAFIPTSNEKPAAATVAVEEAMEEEGGLAAPIDGMRRGERRGERIVRPALTVNAFSHHLATKHPTLPVPIVLPLLSGSDAAAAGAGGRIAQMWLTAQCDHSAPRRARRRADSFFSFSFLSCLSASILSSPLPIMGNSSPKLRFTAEQYIACFRPAAESSSIPARALAVEGEEKYPVPIPQRKDNYDHPLGETVASGREQTAAFEAVVAIAAGTDLSTVPSELKGTGALRILQQYTHIATGVEGKRVQWAAFGDVHVARTVFMLNNPTSEVFGTQEDGVSRSPTFVELEQLLIRANKDLPELSAGVGIVLTELNPTISKSTEGAIASKGKWSDHIKAASLKATPSRRHD